MTATGQGRLPPSVTLRPMSTEQFEEWQGRSIRSYADDLAKATGWPLEASLNKARKQFAELLPAGMGTDRTWILLIVDETGVEVGTLWVGPNSERAGVAFVYDIEIEEEQRGLGGLVPGQESLAGQRHEQSGLVLLLAWRGGDTCRHASGQRRVQRPTSLAAILDLAP